MRADNHSFAQQMVAYKLELAFLLKWNPIFDYFAYLFSSRL